MAVAFLEDIKIFRRAAQLAWSGYAQNRREDRRRGAIGAIRVTSNRPPRLFSSSDIHARQLKKHVRHTSNFKS